MIIGIGTDICDIKRITDTLEKFEGRRPDIVLHGDALNRFNERIPKDCEGIIHLSLSDDPPYAQAFAIVEARKSD